MSDLTQELARYAPPDIPLRLTATGSATIALVPAEVELRQDA